MDIAQLHSLLSTDSTLQLQHFEQLNSTNDYAKKNFDHLSHEYPTMIIADQQSDGHGRFKRAYYSPADGGLYFSLVIPMNDSINLKLLTLITGVTVADSLQKLFSSEDIKLKWINDILYKGKKAGGILAESITDDQGQIIAIVLGIGLNLHISSFPDELKNIATNLPSTDSVTPERILAQIWHTFSTTDQFDQNILEKYRKLCATLGKAVTVVNGHEHLTGIAQDINEDGALVLVDQQKNCHCINSGEVQKVFLN